MTNDELRDFKNEVIVRLTLLIGACHKPRATKKQIAESLERAIKDIQEW